MKSKSVKKFIRIIFAILFLPAFPFACVAMWILSEENTFRETIQEEWNLFFG